MKTFLLIALGGGIGSVLRYLLSRFCIIHTDGSFPVGTLVVNVLGCLLIGLLVGFCERVVMLSAEWRMLLITGFCGGFTTFSTFSSESFTMLRNGEWIMCGLYVLLSVTVGLSATALGWWLMAANK